MGQRVDMTSEGNCISDGIETFGEFREPVLSIPGLLHFPCFPGVEYGMELGFPHYPARVAPQLVRDLESRLKCLGSSPPTQFPKAPSDHVDEYIRPLKAPIKQRFVEEDHAFIASYMPYFRIKGKQAWAWEFLLNGRFEGVRGYVGRVVEEWVRDEPRIQQQRGGQYAPVYRPPAGRRGRSDNSSIRE